MRTHAHCPPHVAVAAGAAATTSRASSEPSRSAARTMGDRWVPSTSGTTPLPQGKTCDCQHLDGETSPAARALASPRHTSPQHGCTALLVCPPATGMPYATLCCRLPAQTQLQFWCCARADGLPPNGRCDFFQWTRGRTVAGAAAPAAGGRAGGGGRGTQGGRGIGAGGNMPKKQRR